MIKKIEETKHSNVHHLLVHQFAEFRKLVHESTFGSTNLCIQSRNRCLVLLRGSNLRFLNSSKQKINFIFNNKSKMKEGEERKGREWNIESRLHHGINSGVEASKEIVATLGTTPLGKPAANMK